MSSVTRSLVCCNVLLFLRRNLHSRVSFICLSLHLLARPLFLSETPNLSIPITSRLFIRPLQSSAPTPACSLLRLSFAASPGTLPAPINTHWILRILAVRCIIHACPLLPARLHPSATYTTYPSTSSHTPAPTFRPPIRAI
ncbi:hypothetical protein BC628DRAFT_1070763 [Trametes gibbosa]|nr:hypothetical protein BC628DRAFT_1070763 [Trametes gibbosa]